MSAFNARNMEVFGTFGENLADVLTNDAIANIDDWDGYLAVKKRYVARLPRKFDGRHQQRP
jgi:hypothetical protein